MKRPDPEAVDLLAEAIWRWALVPLRAHRIETKPHPDKRASLTTYHCEPLAGDDMHDFLHACGQIQAAVEAKALDASEVARKIADAIEKGARAATSAGAASRTRLDPHKRREYRDRAHSAQALAHWLAAELTQRQPVAHNDGAVTFSFSDPLSGREPRAIADLLHQKQWAPVQADTPGKLTLLGAGGSAPELTRAVEMVNSLHWLAGLLREDFNRGRPTGRAAAPWKHTARRLRDLFEQQLGAPMLNVVATLAGLAHQCEVPLAELSKLSKG